MRSKPSRREAIKTVAAGLAIPVGLAGQAPYRPKSLPQDQFRLVSILVDLIIPPSDTPGAAAAGVDRYIDEELAANEQRRTAFLRGLALLEQERFASLASQLQVDLLARYSKESGAAGEFFRLLKDLTVDGYYSTEIGLVKDLGYRGNAFLREFPGCRHPEHP